MGGQGGCLRRIEVFVKIKKKIGGSGWGSWVGGSGLGGGSQGGCERRIEVYGRGQEGGVRWGSGWWGVRVDVNAMLG